MVYNARKRQEGGDTAKNYFKRTEMIAGVQDMRFQVRGCCLPAHQRRPGPWI